MDNIKHVVTHGETTEGWERLKERLRPQSVVRWSDNDAMKKVLTMLDPAAQSKTALDAYHQTIRLSSGPDRTPKGQDRWMGALWSLTIAYHAGEITDTDMTEGLVGILAKVKEARR